MGCLLDDLRVFSIDADQWTTAAPDEGEWRKTAEQGAENFMAKWAASEKARAGLRPGMQSHVCPNVTGRTKKERTTQSKRTRAGSLAIRIVDWPKVARTCILRAFLFLKKNLNASKCFVSFLCLVLFRFRIFLLSLNPRPSVQSSFGMHSPRQPLAVI